MSRRLLSFLIVLVAMHLGATWWYANLCADRAVEHRMEKMQSTLQRLSEAEKEEVFFHRAARRLFKTTFATSPSSPNAWARRRNRWVLNYPRASVEEYYFDRQGGVIGLSSRRDRQGAELLLKCLRDFRVGFKPYAKELEMILDTFWGGRNWRLIIGRPNVLCRTILSSQQRILSIWKWSPDATVGSGPAGILLRFFPERMGPRGCLESALRELQRRRVPVGIIDQQDSQAASLPFGMSHSEANQILDAGFLRPAERLRISAGFVVISSVSDRRFLVGLIPVPSPILPLWSVGALFLWLPWVIRQQMETRTESLNLPSLSLLLVFVVGISAGIPLVLTVTFWWFFSENRTEFVIAEEVKKLEMFLVNIDAQYPSLLRQRCMLYRGLMKEIAGADSPDSTLDKLYQYEFQRYFDSIHLISADGKNLSKSSTSGILMRSIVFFPKNIREKLFSSHVERGYFPYSPELFSLLNFQVTPESIPRLLNFQPFAVEASGHLATMAIQIGQEAIRRVDERNDIEPDRKKPQGGAASSLLIGSIVDSQGGDLGRMLTSMLGDFFHSGRGTMKTSIFNEVIRGPDGRGKYFAILYHNRQTLENAFFERIFRDVARNPDGIFLSASTMELAWNFPGIFEHRKHVVLRERIQAPTRLLSGRDPESGRLFAALECQNACHYLLVASESPENVQARIARLRLQLCLVGLVMAAFLSGLIWRLREAIIIPARVLLGGITAMREKRFDARVIIGTGDEWDALAAAFNKTLEGMEELEIASLIQKKILLSGPISTGPFVFSGFNVMTCQVGGDYYDARIAVDGSLAFVIGDVSGHGVSAALVTAMAKAAFHSQIRSGALSPAAVLNGMNDVLFAQLRRIKMMTLQAGFARPDGSVTISNAGHPYPFFVHPGNPCDIQMVKQIGFPIGTRLKPNYKDLDIDVPSGSRLLLYTDGFCEASNEHQQPLGYPGLASLIGEVVRHPVTSEELMRELLEKLRSFTGSVPWADDVTLAILDRPSMTPYVG
ncbi:MAG: SpoIIE family protein phosphatase [Candidatus Ozemobacteraceae bacterium]